MSALDNGDHFEILRWWSIALTSANAFLPLAGADGAVTSPAAEGLTAVKARTSFSRYLYSNAKAR
jgi:hypothetical protein